MKAFEGYTYLDGGICAAKDFRQAVHIAASKGDGSGQQ